MRTFRNLPLVMMAALLLSLSIHACTPLKTPTPVPDTPSKTPTVAVPADTPTSAFTQTPWVITSLPEASETEPAGRLGIVILSLPDGGVYHLFAMSPSGLPLTRLTSNPWDDITPNLGPDGNWVAFASRRNGYWDLYLLNLENGGTLRLTDTPEYEASPSWSPDGSWLAYEVYSEQSLEIAIRSALDPGSAPILLTSDSFVDTSPAWSPLGRQVAFVSNRSGEPEVWIINLDNATSDQFVNVSQSNGTVESHPSWSPDGTRLAWASTDPASGLTSLMVWNAYTPTVPALAFASGDLPLWQDSDHVVTRVSAPNQVMLAGYSVSSGLLNLPPAILPGDPAGMTFGTTSATLPGIFGVTAALTPEPLYLPALDDSADALPGRVSLVDLPETQAIHPQLSDAADEAFMALRARVAQQAGWDALASLENAFVPLTTPLEPGFDQDWLYTGRAFTISPALIQAGWMVVVREDFGRQTWWRIHLRTLAQDGSQGRPLTQLPWDFSTRTSSSWDYENGGSLMKTIPAGYWLDLTSLAIEYGWERLPALTTWRTYYSGARFNELAFTQGKDWLAAMLELYPHEALQTPTMVIPPTRTPTRTPLYYRSPTPTRTPTARPTLTP